MLLLIIFSSVASLCESVVDVLVAASAEHYAGLITVIGSATNSSSHPENLRFTVLVSMTEPLIAEVEAALLCLATAVRIVPFQLESSWAKGSQLASNARLAEPLNFGRFFAADLLAESRAAIYLDSDVLVLEDLQDLYAEGVEKLDAQSSAVVAVVPREYKTVCGHVVDCDRLEDDGQDLHAFNAGVVVFDLERWKSRHMLASVERWIVENDHRDLYKLGSNPPMILAVRDNFVALDPEWNCMRGLKRQHAHNLRCWEQAKIRHYPGDNKPWNDDAFPKPGEWTSSSSCRNRLNLLASRHLRHQHHHRQKNRTRLSFVSSTR